MNVSVIICTHNPRTDYLQRTLGSLQAQTLPKEQWELLLIDNGSAELLAKKWDLSWHPSPRIVREEKLGITFARMTGVRETRGDLLLYVDDDNVLAPDYLERTVALAEKHPFLGCLGSGDLAPEYEEEPAPEWTEYMRLLALRTVARPMWSNVQNDAATLPWGAGLIVRRNVAERYLEALAADPLRTQLDRKGAKGLLSGGDDEFSWVACEMGLGRGIFPELRITHLIGRNRVQPSYLVRIYEGHAFSRVFFAYIHSREWKPDAALYTWKTRIRWLLKWCLAMATLSGPQRRRRQASVRMDAAYDRGHAKAGAFIARGCSGEPGI
jgi:glycosyltransferase involved in cell wall biosynthesis